jgi:hypothetical protein
LAQVDALLQVNAALALLGLSLVSWQEIARADSTEAFCQLSRHDLMIAVESEPCLFSQRQGNVNVQMGKGWAFRFDANQQGIGYQRENLDNPRIRFNCEGEYTLSVYWLQALQCKNSTDAPVSVVYLSLGDQRQADLAVGNKHVLLPIAPSGSDAWSTVQGADPVPAFVDGRNRRRVAPAGAAPWGAGVGTTVRSCGWRGS